jgi:hypothetical protein
MEHSRGGEGVGDLPPSPPPSTIANVASLVFINYLRLGAKGLFSRTFSNAAVAKIHCCSL